MQRYFVEVLGTVSEELVGALKEDLLALDARYGLTSTVHPVWVESVDAEVQEAQVRLDVIESEAMQ